LKGVKVWGYTGCRCKATVDKGLWGINTGGLVAKLDSICPDGDKCDICKINEIPKFSINLKGGII